jgi:hypothetical protein
MRRPHIPAEFRQRVTVAAKHRCGYCLSSELIVGTAFEIDHIFPFSLGGATEELNLWLACSACNDHKLDRVTAVDPESEATVLIFNPRAQAWSEHFCWSADGLLVCGLTPTGRATVAALQLNRPHLVAARGHWITVGWHPPHD